jgi:hypothetical protein
MEVIGARGSAWLGDGSEAARLALLLVGEVHLPAGERTFCRETPQTAPGDATAGVVLRRWGTQPLQGAAAFVSDTGVVTGSTGQRLSSVRCRPRPSRCSPPAPCRTPSQRQQRQRRSRCAGTRRTTPCRPAPTLEHDGSRVARRHHCPSPGSACHAADPAESLS